MKRFVRPFYYFIRSIVSKNHRFYRISFGERGKILFYDRDRKRFFRVHSRGMIDSVTANQIYSNHEYNFGHIGRAEQVRSIYQRIVDSGRTPLIIDCGANIGLSPQYFAAEFPKARIVAVEPDVGNYDLARKNCEELPNVRLVNAAIGSEAGFVAIDNAGGDANAFRVSRTEAGAGVEVRTIPDLMAEHADTTLFVVKVDIEGFERDLFSQNIDWIDQCPVLVVELHDWMLPTEGSSNNFLRAIAQHDRDFLFKGESVFSIRNGD